MRRYFESLRPADVSAIHWVLGGIFLVWVDKAQYRWYKQKPYYEIRLAVLEPKHLTGCLMTGRLYCTLLAMWKLSWFLRNFGYDAELLGKSVIDEKGPDRSMGRRQGREEPVFDGTPRDLENSQGNSFGSS